MAKEEFTIQHETPQQQLWKYLKTDDQKILVAESLRNLKNLVQEDICYGLIAYLQHGLKRQFSDRWVQRHYNGIVNYLQAERAEGKL